MCVCLNNICRMELLRFFGQWFLGGAWCFWPSTYSKSNTQINTTPKGCHGGQRKRKKPTTNKWNVLLCLFVQVYSLSNGKPWKRLWVWGREMITQSKNGQKGHSWSFWAIFFFFLRRSTFLTFVFNMQRFNNSYYKMLLEIAHFLDDYRV